jgi:hypothetical protein
MQLPSADGRPRYASLILRSGILAAFLATVVPALGFTILSAMRPIATTTSPTAWDIAKATLLLLPITAVSCGSYGFLGGIAGGVLLSLPRRHIHTINKLLIESAIVGFLLGLAYPFFDRLVNGPLLNGWEMLLSAPVGVCCALVCALTFSDRFVPERSSRADP